MAAKYPKWRFYQRQQYYRKRRIKMKIINGVRYGNLFEVIMYWVINVPICVAMLYGVYKFACWLGFSL